MADIPKDDSLALRCAILITPIALTASLLELRFPKPMARAMATLAWMLAIYWFPWRAHLRLTKWLIIVSISTALAVVSSIVLPDWTW
jgi:hypothetical protein